MTAVAEDEGDRARTFVTEVPGVPGAGSFPASERLRLAEERFVSAMVDDLVQRRDEGGFARVHQGVDEAIAAMPEPWRSRTRRELERLREDLVEMLGDEAGAEGTESSTGEGPPTAS